MEILDMYQRLNTAINGVKDDVRDLTIKVKETNGIKADLARTAKQQGQTQTQLDELIVVVGVCVAKLDDHLEDCAQEKKEEEDEKTNETVKEGRQYERRNTKYKNAFIAIMAIIALGSLLILLIRG